MILSDLEPAVLDCKQEFKLNYADCLFVSKVVIIVSKQMLFVLKPGIKNPTFYRGGVFFNKH